MQPPSAMLHSAAPVKVVLLAGALLALVLGARLRPAPMRERFRRGTRIDAGRRRSTGRRGREGWRSFSGSPRTLAIAGIGLAGADETKHFKFIGTTGTGKSTAIRQLLERALARGDRAVISDPDAAYLARFHRGARGDVILNPFEARSLKWDPFSELLHPYDVEQLASGLVPPVADASANEWRAYARTYLAAITRGCLARGRIDVGEYWRLLAVAEAAELRPLVAGTPAQPFLEPENARMFGSIRAVAVSALAPLEYLRRQQAARFSVRRWIRDGSGVLFLPYRADQIAALRSIIAAWIKLAVFEAMNGPEQFELGTSKPRRVWFVVDELDALGQIEGLKDALARLRKFGGRCVLGFQSIAQVSGTYGASEAQTIVENCANTLILRCSASEHGGTAQFASHLIGEREVLRRQTTRSRERDGGLARPSRRSLQTSEQCVVEHAVMPSELEQLPDLHGLLKTASSPVWRRIVLSR